MAQIIPWLLQKGKVGHILSTLQSFDVPKSFMNRALRCRDDLLGSYLAVGAVAVAAASAWRALAVAALQYNRARALASHPAVKMSAVHISLMFN